MSDNTVAQQVEAADRAYWQVDGASGGEVKLYIAIVQLTIADLDSLSASRAAKAARWLFTGGEGDTTQQGTFEWWCRHVGLTNMEHIRQRIFLQLSSELQEKVRAYLTFAALDPHA